MRFSLICCKYDDGKRFYMSCTGILEVKFQDPNEILVGIGYGASMYTEQISHLDRVVSTLYGISVTPDNEAEIGYAIGDIANQKTIYESKTETVSKIALDAYLYCTQTSAIENSLANHFDENWGDFCDDNGIEYDDPEEYSFGEFLGDVGDFFEDVGDGIKAFYEAFEYAIDFIIDAALVVVAVVGVIVALGALTVATGGAALFFAGATLVAAGFAAYESICNFAASSLAFGHSLLGNEEQAKVYGDIRDDGAGKYVFVGLTSGIIGEENAKALYSVISLTCTVINVVNIASGGYKAFTEAGKGLSGVKAAFKTLFVPKKSDNVDDAMNMICYDWGLQKFGINRTIPQIIKEYEYVSDMGASAKIFDSLREFVEADEYAGFFKGFGGLVGLDSISESADLYIKSGDLVDDASAIMD